METKWQKTDISEEVTGSKIETWEVLSSKSLYISLIVSYSCIIPKSKYDIFFFFSVWDIFTQQL